MFSKQYFLLSSSVKLGFTLHWDLTIRCTVGLECLWVDDLVDYVQSFLYHPSGYYCTSGVDRQDPGASSDTINCTCPEQAVFTGESCWWGATTERFSGVFSSVHRCLWKASLANFAFEKIEFFVNVNKASHVTCICQTWSHLGFKDKIKLLVNTYFL